MCLKISLKRAGNKHVFLLRWVLKCQLDLSRNSAVSHLVLLGFTHWEGEEMFSNQENEIVAPPPPDTHNWQAIKGKKRKLENTLLQFQLTRLHFLGSSSLLGHLMYVYLFADTI